MPRFHAQDDVLFDYASGSLPAPVSLLVAAHLSFCGQCRDDVASIETIGGAYLEAIDPVPMEAGALESAFDRLAGAEVETSTGTGQNAGPKFADGLDRLPSPLSRFLAARDRATVWTRRARGIEEIDVIADDDRFSASLMRIQPGVSIPNHTHTGRNLRWFCKAGSATVTSITAPVMSATRTRICRTCRSPTPMRRAYALWSPMGRSS